ncbi:MAG: hypothetical protein ACD_8C00134G0004 [uncultured bacterium]|nr:MAG: hypothetical protein ACD_8C00134G0004 [uncultured bacterium]
MVVRGLNGRVSEIRFSHHPGAVDIKGIIENATRGEERSSALTTTDGMVVFSYKGKHVACTSEEDALTEMHKSIVRGSAYMMPLKDGFLDGIVIALA